MLTETAFLVLNALYLKKMGDLKAVVECVRLPEDTVQSALAQAVENGEILHINGEYLLDVSGRRARTRVLRSRLSGKAYCSERLV
ncbi:MULTISPECIES: hypothetical protein [Paraburkholderia]|uniref:Uncharacterized protein n=1 Tax=Paraburkholderia podalyriae TaxID=1938811 RepID=A0ABR7Q0M6_9BURK|nr:hypothetical protein [Paraburkholderia podalyriae]MBC8752096.1 hypothetical protein [Paraburkholderia podalyriae]